VTKDIIKAIEWFTKAAEKGFANAVKELRELGQPVPVA
jgi:TPR repeat protein